MRVIGGGGVIPLSLASFHNVVSINEIMIKMYFIDFKWFITMQKQFKQRNTMKIIRL